MRVQNWMIEVSVVALIIGATAGLTACGDRDPNARSNQPYTKYDLDVDGCVVKAINNPKGPDFFIAKCPASSETVTHQRPQGKSSVTDATITTNGPSASEIAWQLELAQARVKALGKLSDVDKRVLGIKE